MNYIDLKNSYIYLSPNSTFISRVDIKSILEDHSTNTKYFLTKEIRQEVIGPNPFDHPGKAEYCAIVNDKKERLDNRDISPVLFPFFNKQKQKLKSNHDMVASDDEIDLKFINYPEIPNLDSNINFYLNLFGSILIILIPIILYYRNKNKKTKNETIREFLNNFNNEK